MKKVLFIIQSYPSKRSANVLCDEKIMREMLANEEFEIHCLVYRFYGQLPYEEINGLKVHRLERGTWWLLYTYAREIDRKPFYRFLVKLNRIFMRIKQVIFIPIYPNYEPMLADKLARRAIGLHKIEHFDLVVAEHSGRDTLFAGRQLKNYDSNVRLVSILWDPISGRDLAKYLPRKYAYRKMLKDEIHLLDNSDRIICMQSNRRYQEVYSKDKPFFRNVRFLDIPGIIRPTIRHADEAFTRKGMINLLYSGILTLPDRDPSVLIEMIKRSRYADRINIMFFVAGDEGKAKASLLLADFKGNSIIHSYIPQALLDCVASHSDALINIGGPNPGMVPSKIFEYMSLGKPILSTYYIDKESSKSYLEHYSAAVCIDIREPIDRCVDCFERFIEHNLYKEVLFEEVEKQFPINSPQKYIEVFKELF